MIYERASKSSLKAKDSVARAYALVGSARTPNLRTWGSPLLFTPCHRDQSLGSNP